MKTAGTRGSSSGRDGLDDDFQDGFDGDDAGMASEEAPSAWDALPADEEEDGGVRAARASGRGRSALAKVLPWFAVGVALAGGGIYFLTSNVRVGPAQPSLVTESPANGQDGGPFVVPVPDAVATAPTSQAVPTGGAVSPAVDAGAQVEPPVPSENADSGVANPVQADVRPADPSSGGMATAPLVAQDAPPFGTNSPSAETTAPPASSPASLDSGPAPMSPPPVVEAGPAPSVIPSVPPAITAMPEPRQTGDAPVGGLQATAVPPAPAPAAVATVVATPAATVSNTSGEVVADLSSRLDVLEHRMDDLTKAIDRLAEASAARTATPVAAAPPVVAPEIAAQMTALQTDVRELKAGLKDLAARPVPTTAPAAAQTASAPAVAPTASVPTASRPAPVARPVVKWVLRGAQEGEAWISRSGSEELQHVAVGETVTGLGRITAIRQERGAWVIVGTAGTVRQ